MKITIETMDNGYIVRNEYPQNDDEAMVTGGAVFQEDACEQTNERQAVIEMLTHVAELLGFTYDKYKEDNINISFDKKGHKL